MVDQVDKLKVLGRSRGYCKDELIKNIKRHVEFRPILLNQIKNIPEVVLRNLGTPQARRIHKMMKEVFTEAYRAKQFTRTEINERGVLYGIVALKHRVMDLVLNYFHERWPKCVICLYNEIIHKTALINESGEILEYESSLEDIVEQVSKERETIPYFSDIQFSGKEIFETLYKSQNITERENVKYFRRMIPKNCYTLPGMREGIEKRFKNKDLQDFI